MTTLDDRLQLAYAAQRAKNTQLAEQIYREVLGAQPDHPDALHYLGLLLCEGGERVAGEAMVRRSIELAGDRPNFFNNLGIVLAGVNDLKGACEVFYKAAELAPSHPDYHRNAGITLERLGEIGDAEREYRTAVRLSPCDGRAVIKLAQLLRSQRRYSEIVPLVEQALAPGPDPLLHNELAEAYRGLRDDARAVEHYSQAAALLPDSAEAQHNLAQALRDNSRLVDGLECSRRAVELSPTHVEMRFSLASALKDLGHDKEAVAEFVEVLKLAPEHPGATHLLAALRGETLDRCSPEYVARLFNHYAPNFEEHLTERLHYQGPELLRQAFQSVTDGNVNNLNVIDLGCGTGLCGPLFRAVARNLIGVDLSDGMLELAKARGCYDELIQADAVTTLLERPGSVQLITAADVVNYFGDLSELFKAAVTALSKGWFLLTVERGDDDGYRLAPSGRFRHAPAYVEKVATANGFQVRSSQRLCFRFDRGQPVHAQVYVLEKG